MDILFLKVSSMSEVVGRNIKKSNIQEILGFQLTGIKRDNVFLSNPHKSTSIIYSDDILIYIGVKLSDKNKIEFNNYIYTLGFLDIQETEFNPSISIGKIHSLYNPYINKTIKQIDIKNNLNLIVLGIFRNNKYINTNLSHEYLKVNDLLLVHGLNGTSEMEIHLNKICHKVVVLSGIYKKPLPKKYIGDILVFISFIGIITSGFIPNLSTTIVSLIGCMSFIIFRVLDYQDVKDSLIRYSNILILTGLSLGITKILEISGIIEKISIIIQNIENISPWSLFFLIHLVTSILSIMLSNASVIALMIPLIKLIFMEHPLFVSVILCCIHGASCCFASPTGYHTNLMILNIGGYRCYDFLLLGIPLHLLSSVIFATSVYFL
jgi:di/tricarboxylate transporter